jgi:hypothetical protein
MSALQPLFARAFSLFSAIFNKVPDEKKLCHAPHNTKKKKIEKKKKKERCDSFVFFFTLSLHGDGGVGVGRGAQIALEDR